MPTLATIRALVAGAYGVSENDLAGPTRRHGVSRPRHIAFWLARRTTKESLAGIGRAFGGRNHKTVFYGVRKIEWRRHDNADVRRETDAMLARLGG